MAQHEQNQQAMAQHIQLDHHDLTNRSNLRPHCIYAMAKRQTAQKLRFQHLMQNSLPKQ